VKKFAIFIATTGGPIQIERLTEERAPQSMICISGSTTILPISKKYHDFVRRGSGIIEREFNLIDNISFRADVSGVIDSGKSWQLGFFLAHAVTSSKQATLVNNPSDADCVIWATGCVDYDLNVLKVDHLIEKLKTSSTLLSKLKLEKKSTTLIFPNSQNENISDVRAFADAAEIYAADKLHSLLDILKIDTISEPLKTQPPNGGLVASSWRTPLTWTIIITIIISLFSVWFFSDLPTLDVSSLKPSQPLEKVQTEIPLKSETTIVKIKPTEPMVKILEQKNVKLFALGPPEGKTCINVIFSGIEPKKVPIDYDGALKVTEQKLEKVCRLLFEFSPRKNKYFAAVLNKVSGRYVRFQKKPEALAGVKLFSTRQSWTIELPRKMKEPFHYHLITLSSDKPLSNDLKWLQKQTDIVTAQKELVVNGIHTSTFLLRVTP